MTKTRRPWHLLLTGLGMMALLGVTPARADDDHHKHQDHKHQDHKHQDHKHQERREHERHDHEWHERQAWCAHHACGPGYAYAPPPMVYAPPPPVVYAPPPPPPVVYVPPAVYAPPGVNIVVPIHIK